MQINNNSKMKKGTLIVLLFVVNFMYSQTNSNEKAIKKTINTFFEGLHKGDTAIINTTINTTLKMQTIYVNKEGNSILKTETKRNFLTAISKKKAEDVWFEKLLSITVKIDGNLASVWTPYEFYFNNKFSHCGVNSFQLFNNNGNWEIAYLVDTRRKQDCNVEE